VPTGHPGQTISGRRSAPAPAARSALPAALKPITLGAFVLTETGVEIDGQKVTWPNFQGAFEFAKRAHRSSGFWLADLLAYGESRKDWENHMSHMADATGLTVGTLRNVRMVAKIPPARRRAGVEFSHHVEVVPLEPADQDEFLERAETEGWSVRDLRDAIQAKRRRVVLKGRADTMHTVEVSVQLEIEAPAAGIAEDRAWEVVKKALLHITGARVIASHARPR
jgi:hypothetical protein